MKIINETVSELRKQCIISNYGYNCYECILNNYCSAKSAEEYDEIHTMLEAIDDICNTCNHVRDIEDDRCKNCKIMKYLTENY